MAYRRFRRRTFQARRRRFTWARSTFNNVGPVHAPAANVDDLLTNFRSAIGWTINFPDIVIWRIHLKVSLYFSYSPAAYAPNTGVNFAILVDDVNKAPFVSPVTKPYSENFMMWTELYAAENEQLTEPTTGTGILFKEFDIKSRRKLRTMDDSLFSSIVEQGNCSLTGYSITSSVLLKLP